MRFLFFKTGLDLKSSSTLRASILMDHDDDDGDCYSYSGDGGDDDGRIGVNGVLLFISKTPTAV